MNKAVANVLNRVLGDWVKDLNSDQLKLSVFSGEVSLTNLHLSENILHVLGFPFDLQHGSIGKIKVSIPWTSILSSSLSIEISDVFAYLTPKHPSTWSEVHEKEAIANAKISALKQFEAMSDSALEEATSSGYLASYATTIVNNIQISIKNIYIRYEDTISSSDAFAVGLSLKSLHVQTCNSKWVPEYTSDAEICYKLIEVKDFQLFCDYNVPVVKFRDIYKGGIDEAFIKLARDDLNKELAHNHILTPFSFSLKIKVALKPNYSSPQFDVEFNAMSLFFNFYSGQIKLFLKFAEFMNLYNVFKAGVFRSIGETKFDENTENIYKDAYVKWKAAKPDSGESQNYLTVLQKIEMKIENDDIRRVRSKTVQEVEHRKTVDLKKIEIENMKNEKQGRLAKVSGLFFGPSEAEKEKLAIEKQKKLELAEKELNKLMEAHPGSLQFLKTTSAEEKEWVKIRFQLMIHQGGFDLCHEKSKLLIAKFENFGISGGLKESCMFFTLDIKEFTLKECIEKSEIYPYIFESYDFQVVFNQNPMEVKLYSGDVYMCSIFSSIMEIANIFQQAATANVDISDYVNAANNRVNGYINDGQGYLKGVIAEEGASSPIKLEMKLKAPKLVIPINVHSKSTYIVMNLGEIECKTSNSLEDQVKYENYEISLGKLESYVVWDHNWEAHDKITESHKDFLLHPVKISTKLSKAGIVNFEKPGFKVMIIIDNITLDANEKKVKLLLELQNLFVKDEIAPIVYQIPKTQGPLEERKSMLDNLSEFKRIVPMQISVKLEHTVFILTEDVSCLCKVAMQVLEFKMSTDSYGNMSSQICMKKFSVKDMRKNAQLRDIIANPYLHREENMDSQQLNILITMHPLQHVTDIGVMLNDLRIVASKDFVSALMQFASKHAAALSAPAAKPKVEILPIPSYFIIYETNARYTLCLKTFELWLPTVNDAVEQVLEKIENSKSNAAQLSFCLTTVYMTGSQAKYVYADDDTLVRRDYIWCKEEASVTLSHFGGYLINSIDCESENKKLISPCRISLEYNFVKDREELKSRMNLNVRLECICMLIGFKDMEFFKALAKHWQEMPNFTPAAPAAAPVKKEEIVEEIESLIEISLDADAIQVTIVDDTDAQSASLLHIQISNIGVIGEITAQKKAIRTEIIMFIDYFNKKSGAWEPALEDWKFICKYFEESTTSIVSLKSTKVLNFNLTYHFVEVLGKLMEKLSENPGAWQKSEQDKEKSEHGSIVYELQNNTKIPMKAWIELAKSEKKWDVLDEPKIFSQSHVNKLHARNKKKLKHTSVMDTIQAPTNLIFSFADDGSNPQSVIIEEVSMNIFSMQTSKFSFPCLVEVSVKGGKRIIRFEPGIFISNNSEQLVTLELKGESIEICPNSYQSLSYQWCNDLEKVRIQAKIKNLKMTRAMNKDDQPTLTENSVFSLQNEVDLVCDVQEYELKPNRFFKVIEFNPLFFLRNMLHHSLTIVKATGKPTKTIQPGEEMACGINPDKTYSLEVNYTNEEMKEVKHSTSKINLVKKKKIEHHFEDIPSSSILVSSEEKVFENYSGLKNFAKKSDKKKIISRVIDVYSEYIIVNKTQFDLILNDMELPTNGNVYYSPSSSSCRLKLKNINTKLSQKFSIDTVGVSGMIEVPQVEEKTPRQFLFGLSIAQAPAPYTKSKIVTFVPRFMIWNYLELPISIRQYGVPDSNISTLSAKSDQKNSMPYYFDNYKKSKAIIVSDPQVDPENDPSAWSGPFSLENIEDFQVKFVSKPTEVENKLNPFLKGWFIPRSGVSIRYARVFIYSQDEATVHIVFLDPKDPDFQILNNSTEDLNIRQLGCEKIYKLPKESTIYWAWENHLLEKKRIEIIPDQKKEIKHFSLEKVKEIKKKKFKKQEVALIVDGVTRKLVIKYEREVVEMTAETMMQDRNSTTTMSLNSNKTIALKAMPKSTSQKNKDLKKTGLLDLLKSESSFTVQLLISEIGISIVDEESDELFYICMKDIIVFRETLSSKSGINLKIQTNDKFAVEHFQLDYMGPNQKLFPVMIYPVRREKEVETVEKDRKKSDQELLFSEDKIKNDNDTYSFIAVVIQRESSIRLKRDGTIMTSMDKFSNVGILMQAMQIKLNEESIYNLLKIKNFFNALTPTPKKVDLTQHLTYFQSSLPEIPFNPTTFQRKAYFQEVDIRSMKFSLTFKPAGTGTKPGSEYDSGFLIFSLIKKLGGAFINVSESPFSFTQVLIMDAFQTIDSFTWILMKKYINQALRQFYKIFGSIDIIGNPLGLIDKLGTGVIEFFSAPAKGLIGGPRSFAKGLGKGVSSLTSAVIGGTFGSISKISGSLYNVLRTATGDEVLSQDVNTEHIGKDMAVGLKYGFLDVANGISGIVVKPYKGAKAAGVKGLFKGMLSGTAGLVTFPLKIVLKFSSVISTTIASTSILITEGKIQKYGKTRFPRQFGAKKILEPYSVQLAQAQALLRTLEKSEKYKKERMVYYTNITLSKNQYCYIDKNIIILLTTNYFVYILDEELHFDVRINKIERMEVHVFKGVYFLGIATLTKNFAIPSGDYSLVASIYNAILYQAPKLANFIEHKFEIPKFASKELLMEFEIRRSSVIAIQLDKL